MSMRNPGSRFLAAGLLLSLAASAVHAAKETPMNEAPAAIIAINVLLEPDAAMQERAKALNARLRQSFPDGFALDETHTPHISLLHRFVRLRDLEPVYAAVEAVLAHEPSLPWQLAATGYEVGPWAQAQMVSIGVRKTPELVRLQRALVEALARYAVPTGDASAFFQTPDSPGIDSQTIEYVRDFVPAKIGAGYHPHVTAGLSSAELARAIRGESFAEAPFSAVRVAIHQLGNDGTARKRLWPQ